jgi:hypothetical protein
MDSLVQSITSNPDLLFSLLLSNTTALQELMHNHDRALNNLEVSFMNLLLLLTCYFFNKAFHVVSMLLNVFIMM